MWDLFSGRKKIVSIASNQDVIVLRSETQDVLVSRFRIHQVPPCEFRGPLPQCHTRCHRERRDRKEISNRFAAHLASHEHINLSAMILVIGEAFVNLRAGQVRETLRNYTIDGLTIL